MSILLSQQIKYLESSLLTPVEGETHYSSDVAEEREGALDAVLLHAQTGMKLFIAFRSFLLYLIRKHFQNTNLYQEVFLKILDLFFIHFSISFSHYPPVLWKSFRFLIVLGIASNFHGRLFVHFSE